MRASNSEDPALSPVHGDTLPWLLFFLAFLSPYKQMLL
jgi:hypothetical protein